MAGKKSKKKSDKKKSDKKKKLLKLKLQKKKESKKKEKKKKVAKKKESKKKEALKKEKKKKPVKEAPAKVKKVAPEQKPEVVEFSDHSSNYKVGDAIKKMRELKSVEDLMAFVKGETRVTVTKAIPSVQRQLAAS